jgi:HPt (histidine-containing phosphotransfer) domain-containing protein
MSYELDADCDLPPHLIDLFLRSAPNQLQQLLALCAARDGQGARAQAHKLKGSLYAAGASRLAERIEALRGALAAADWRACETLLVPIRDDFAALLKQLTASSRTSEP